ncbi:S41 family peptidase [Streptomyces sp. NPDC006529]|uniref:S41 family peptidase n=1 Tax=Streptomyces sp. NPDC006529 TaxID=3157177 RepID=UPI0033B3FBE3
MTPTRSSPRWTGVRSAVRRWRAAPVFLAVVLLLAGDGWSTSGSAGRQAPQSARAYLAAALDVMEARSVRRNQVDWPRLRRTAFARAEGARTASDTYAVITEALAELGDHHSTFLTGTEAAISRQRTEDTFTGLTGRRLPGAVGYLALPAVGGADETLDRYVRQGRAAVGEAEREGGACGWMLDLRQNTGGNVWPMFAVAAPLLGEGKVGAFVTADGAATPWSVENRRPRLNGEESPWGPADPLGTPDPPVAVLTDGGTASAAEALLIAFKGRPDTRTFGTSTYGVPTGNDGFPLSDGAVINLTTELDADRTGRTYDGAIPPDEEVPASRADIGTDRDEVVKAAARWLAGQGTCRRP